ncbi:unnamed protein product [Paramecium primaurelia]|uniref:Uncharacterized protein n=1 Tax=Paramecium primaurelia TaxID=5886 RepID=A0A8S1LWV7_PARPR|nr:unnamed protein product [Paramecium primaurelia]
MLISHLTLPVNDIEFVDALILTASSQEESFWKFQLLANKHQMQQIPLVKQYHL